MAIDWLDSSADIIDARRIGYEEGLAEGEAEVGRLEEELELEQASKDDALKMMMGISAAIMLGSQESALASPDGCGHRVRVALNDSCAICLVCRSKIEGTTSFGVYLSQYDMAKEK